MYLQLTGLLFLSFVSYRYWKWLKLGFTMGKLLLTQSTNQVSPAKHVAGQVYEVTYEHNGGKYRLFFPIRCSAKQKMLETQVYLTIGDVVGEISQQPGVPYLIVPEDISSDAVISFISEDDGRVDFRGRDYVGW